MCTVVVRWAPGEPALLLALRDELVGRDFDDPGAWWPAQPGVIGGRDRTAGGSWCVTAVETGVTALVLNRPQRRQAAPGAPSRGVLPLLVAQHGQDWHQHVERAGMASFALVRVAPEALTLWVFDGVELTSEALSAGTHMVTSGGAEDGRAVRSLADFTAAGSPTRWQQLLAGREPADDPAALLVRHERDGQVFGTVFGQVIETTIGALSLSFSRTPSVAGSWTQRRWPEP